MRDDYIGMNATEAGDREIEVTPEMIEAGLAELRAFALAPEENDDRAAAERVIKAALANRSRPAG